MVLNIFDLFEDSVFYSRADIEANLRERGEYAKYRKGESLIEENDKSESVFVVMKGMVDVLKEIEWGEPIRIATLSDGAVIGEMGVFLNLKRSASIQARTEVEVISISNRDFLELLRTIPELAIGFLGKYSEKISSLNIKVAKMTDKRILLVLGAYILPKVFEAKDEKIVDINITTIFQETKLKKDQILSGLDVFHKFKVIDNVDIEGNKVIFHTDYKKLLDFIKIISNN